MSSTIVSAIVTSMIATSSAISPSTIGSMATDIQREQHPIVIVLDAGHGGNDSGAVGNGVTEKSANLSIAHYLSAYLSSYRYVRVIMTRTDDSYLSLGERTDVAVKNHADMFISLHSNFADIPQARGASVYVSHSSAAGNSASKLASSIESRLYSIGLRYDGVMTRASEDGETYSWGETSDYYAVIRYCTQAKIPSMIVEHAYVSNGSDASRLASASGRRRIAQADAKAIASYFSLPKKTETIPGVPENVAKGYQ